MEGSFCHMETELCLLVVLNPSNGVMTHPLWSCSFQAKGRTQHLYQWNGVLSGLGKWAETRWKWAESFSYFKATRMLSSGRSPGGVCSTIGICSACFRIVIVAICLVSLIIQVESSVHMQGSITYRSSDSDDIRAVALQKLACRISFSHRKVCFNCEVN